MSEAPPSPSIPNPIPRNGSERSDARFNAFKQYLLVHPPVSVNGRDNGKCLSRGHETNVNIQPSTTMNQPPGPTHSAAASGNSLRRYHSETSMNETSRRASSGRIATEYAIRDVASGRGGNDRNENQGLRMPSLRRSASERIKLRQMLLGESVGGNENDGTSNIDMRGSGHAWQYQPVSASRKSLRGSGHSSCHSLRSSDAGQNYHCSKSAQTANEEWPEFTSNNLPHREIGARSGKLSRNEDFDAAKGRRETIRTFYSLGENSEDNDNCRETVRASNNGRGNHAQGIRSCEAQMKDDDLQFNNDVRHRSAGRRVSLPNLCGSSPNSNQHHTELGNSTNSAGSAAMMAEYIALKVKVAELQSELQVAHSQAQKYTSGLKQAQEKMEKLRDDNAKLSRQNAELSEENASLVALLGPGTRDRLIKQKSKGGGLATIDGGRNDKMMIPTKTEGRRQTSSNAKRNNSWKKPELDWGSINDSDRTGSKILQSLRDGGEKMPAAQGGEDPTRPKRRHSWWVKRSASMPADQMLVQDFPPRRSSEPPNDGGDDASTASQRQRRGWGPWTRRNSDEAACGSGDQINSRPSFVESMMNIPRTLSKPQLASEGRDSQKEVKEGKKEPLQQKKEVVPEYIQFNEDDEANLRCSDLSFDVVLSASFTKLAQEALERSGLEQLRMSDIDEQGSKYNDAPAAVPTGPGENGERGHAKSGTTSDAESFSLWRSSGPLAYSMTTEQDGGNATPNDEQQPEPKGESDESLRVEESDDDNLSFAFSSVGGATPADEPLGESATQAEI